MKPISLKIEAGKSEWFSLGAGKNYVRIKSASCPVIIASVDGVTSAELQEGDYVRLPEFDGLFISHEEATEQSVVLYVGAGDEEIGSTRVGGVVQVVATEKIRSQNDEAYWGLSHVIALAGEYAHVQIYNPAGSGKRLVVNQLAVAMNMAGAFHVRRGVVLANLYSTQPVSKLFGSVKSTVAEMRYQSSATMLGGVVSSARISTVDETYKYNIKEPVVLGPGEGVIIINVGNVGADCLLDVQFFEEDLV